MRIIEYTCIRIRRRMVVCLAIALTSICLTALICVMNQSLLERQAGLKEAKTKMEVACTVSNVQGTKADGLFISPSYIDLMTGPSYPMHGYICNLLLKKTLLYTVPNSTVDSKDEKRYLIGITQRSASPALSYENSSAVIFDPRYSDAVFDEEGFICVAGEALSPYVSTDQTGGKSLELTVDFSSAGNDVQPRTYRFTVAGSVANGNPWAVYCNWDAVRRIFEAEGEMPDAESMAFSLADNNRIEEFRALASRFFTEPDYAQEDTGNKLALTINDTIYRQTVASYEKSILILSILKPFIFLCSFVIGSFVSFLVTRGRRKEFAILNSMGTTKKTMLLQGTLEMTILCLLGAFIGFFLVLLWRSLAFGFVGADIALYILCNTFGSFISIYRSLSIPTINLLRERQ